jgi:glutamine---fructose-6-phosphate transaminase (isomerizing)
MCGIVGITSKNAFSSKEILSALKRLEYRGYDSAGIVTNAGILDKVVGSIDPEKFQTSECTAGISHTRWATHGGVTKENAHPHADCFNTLFVVHNGILENYLDMKKELEKRNHIFRSETDSEVIAHYLEDKFAEKSPELAIVDFLKEAKGTFAILLLQKGSDKIYAIKKDSPLVLGISNDKMYLASDIYAFSGQTQDVIFFEDNEFASISPTEYIFYDKDGDEIEKFPLKVKTFEEKHDMRFDHYMLKEIYDQPLAAKRLLDSLQSTQTQKLERLLAMIRKSQKIVFLASGTSYHATLLGVYFLHKAGIDAQALIASEFKDYSNIDSESLLIAMSQSGETMDVIDALKSAKASGAKIASIVNTPFSTIQRMSDLSLEIYAGQEICVAATKSFTNQVLFLLYLASKFGYKCDLAGMPEKISSLFEQEEKISFVANQLKDKKDIYIIGRGLSYPVAREIALKLKEISYIHAEGMMGGELKHGTLALIEESTPVLALINGDSHIISNVKEAEARGAKIIAITNKKGIYRDEIVIPADNDAEFSILAAIVGQMLTYYIAKEKGLPIDKPRNLAKSCTVI